MPISLDTIRARRQAREQHGYYRESHASQIVRLYSEMRWGPCLGGGIDHPCGYPYLASEHVLWCTQSPHYSSLPSA